MKNLINQGGIMPESRSHKRAKGASGRTEIPISRGRRLDARRGRYAIEVERSGSPQRIGKAISRLKTQSGSKKIIRVPQSDIKKAVGIAKKSGVKLSVTNLSKTKRRTVK